MNYLIISLLIIGIVVIIKTLFKQKNNNKYSHFDVSHYKRKRYFFSKNENSFFKRLYKIIYNIDNNKYIIFSKVRVSDIIDTNNQSKWGWKTINPWHFDFVICDIENDFEPIAIIELDDNSHNNEFVIQRDNIKNEICKYINLPLLRTYGTESDEKLKQSLIEIL